MATIEKRIQLTPSSRTAPLLRELSSLTGKPVATIVREILDESVPALEMTVAAFRQIAERPDQVQEAIARLASKAQQSLAQVSMELDLVAKPGRKPRRGRGAAKTG